MVVADADDLGADDLRRPDRLRPEQRHRAVHLHAVLAARQQTILPLTKHRQVAVLADGTETYVNLVAVNFLPVPLRSKYQLPLFGHRIPIGTISIEHEFR